MAVVNGLVLRRVYQKSLFYFRNALISHGSSDCLLCRHASFTNSLHSNNKNKESSTDGQEAPVEDTAIDARLVSAVKSVAEALPGNKRQTASDLLQQLKAQSKLTDAMKTRGQPDKPAPSIDALFSGMKIDKLSQDRREPSSIQEMPTGQRQERVHRKSTRREANYDGDFFKGPGLGIFKKSKTLTDIIDREESTSLWTEVEKHQMKRVEFPSPSNAFEEMIQWTKQGKLWTFPIDNSKGFPEEDGVGFHEHIFLEPLIQDFPKGGPLRHFMEIVIAGLSKNPYLTVDMKKEHIQWYREYFKQKQSILDEAMTSSVKAENKQ